MFASASAFVCVCLSLCVGVYHYSNKHFLLMCIHQAHSICFFTELVRTMGSFIDSTFWLKMALRTLCVFVRAKQKANRTASDIFYVPHFHHHHHHNHNHNLKEILIWMCHNFELLLLLTEPLNATYTKRTISFANKLATLAIPTELDMLKLSTITKYVLCFCFCLCCCLA